ncbi:MAG: NifU family protein [Chitinophagales bacterium]|nr:NifU family protein [Bacteroidota bacterium]MCB9043910.1 NifU family protein [Chitinophagales bacterium]
MQDTYRTIISIYTEATPNPETMKFVLNKMLFAQNSVDFPDAESVNGASDLADALFLLPFVKSVFIANNFVTIGKNPKDDWYEIIPSVKELLKKYLSEEKSIVNAELVRERKIVQSPTLGANETEIVKRIEELLQKYVQPAVERDGGSIVFRGFDNGKVILGMQGACSGCPSSQITLKAGIEGMMKRMIPEVTEVVAEAL